MQQNYPDRNLTSKMARKSQFKKSSQLADFAMSGLGGTTARAVCMQETYGLLLWNGLAAPIMLV